MAHRVWTGIATLLGMRPGEDKTESAERDVPDYIEVDHTKLTGSLKRIPKLGDVPYPVQMEPNLVIEFYSR